MPKRGGGTATLPPQSCISTTRARRAPAARWATSPGSCRAADGGLGGTPLGPAVLPRSLLPPRQVFAQEIDEHWQRHGKLPSAWIVEEQAGPGRRPFFQERHQPLIGGEGVDEIGCHVGDARLVQRGAEHQPPVVDNDRAPERHFQLPAALRGFAAEEPAV